VTSGRNGVVNGIVGYEPETLGVEEKKMQVENGGKNARSWWNVALTDKDTKQRAS